MNKIYFLILLITLGTMSTTRSWSQEQETTAAISVIEGETASRRSPKNIGGGVLGHGLGLVSLQSAGRYASQNPTFYVRGLQTLGSANQPLILVDGIERDITSLSAEEVEQVQILKDAAATAIYGYKGVNGVINILTKHGQSETKSIRFSYDHVLQKLDKPRMVDAYTYASAINEARINDGLSPRYNSRELEAFSSGSYPYLYPNVNWMDETFRDWAHTNRYDLEFRGGSKTFRYFALMNLISDRGFINNSDMNEGYSTQDKYSRGNLRMNFDIDLTPTIFVGVNVSASLAETSRPGSAADLWDIVYTVPSAAFPIADETGTWAGSDTWAGTLNPVAQAQGAAYYRNHTRSLFSDITVRKNLESITPGLSAWIRVGYDNIANIYEDHSRTYVYTVTSPTFPDSGEPTYTRKSYGAESSMGSDARVNTFARRLHLEGGADYRRTWQNHALHGRLMWDYEYEDPEGINNTLYRQNVVLQTHYGYADRYLADLALVESGSSRLAPGTKWSFSPTASVAWVMSKESWLAENPWIGLLKLRASAGIQNADFLPGDGVWTYYAQQYQTSGTTYPFGSGWTSEFGTTQLGQLATADPSHEVAYKVNAGIDARIKDALDITVDVFGQQRKNIWVDASGKYSSVLGNAAPYENAGRVDSWGIEVGADWTHQFGYVRFNIGGNFNFNRSEIVEQLEEPRLYPNLVQTGHRVGQVYGLKAIGFFADEADIANSPTQNFSSVRPGDIKYADINSDGVIDANDKEAIGYGSIAPEIYYNMHIGAEWKGWSLFMNWQGAGHYSAILNTKSMYYPLVSGTTLSEHYYENRWTPERAADALYPRLSSQSNANNYQANTVFLADRSYLKLREVELSYDLPERLLDKLKFVSGIRLYARGIDLLSFDHLEVGDPEAYGIYPLSRNLAFGAKLTF